MRQTRSNKYYVIIRYNYGTKDVEFDIAMSQTSHGMTNDLLTLSSHNADLTHVALFEILPYSDGEMNKMGLVHNMTEFPTIFSGNHVFSIRLISPKKFHWVPYVYMNREKFSKTLKKHGIHRLHGLSFHEHQNLKLLIDDSLIELV